MSAPIHLAPPVRPFRLKYQRVSWGAPERVALKRSNAWPAPDLHTMAWAAAAFEPLPDDRDTASMLPAFVPPPPPLSMISLQVPTTLPALDAPATSRRLPAAPAAPLAEPPSVLPAPQALPRADARTEPPSPLPAPQALPRARALAAPVGRPLSPPIAVLAAPRTGRPLAPPAPPTFDGPPADVATALPAPLPTRPVVPVASAAAPARTDHVIDVDVDPIAEAKPRLIGLRDIVITLAVAAATAATALAALAIF